MAADDVGILAAFGGGMLSFLSPCVLPLVPGYLSLMSGVSVAELQRRDAGVDDGVDGDPAATRRVLRATLLFVAGFSVVFVALGLAASAVGSTLLEHRIGLNRAAGVAVIAMGLFLAGAVPSRLLLRERRFQVSPSRLGVWAPPIMGMAFAFGWTPCIGPILGGVLTLAENQDTVARGGLLLAVYSLGLGVPFVVSGLALHRLEGFFGWFKRHARAVDLVAGALLVVFGVILLTNRVGRVSGDLVDLLERLHLGKLAQI